VATPDPTVTPPLLPELVEPLDSRADPELPPVLAPDASSTLPLLPVALVPLLR
jgi:hypothetical protein